MWAVKAIDGSAVAFVEDAPDTAEVTRWVQEFAAFNEKTGGQNGNYVR